MKIYEELFPKAILQYSWDLTPYRGSDFRRIYFLEDEVEQYELCTDEIWLIPEECQDFGELELY